jgi:hypothetical protein
LPGAYTVKLKIGDKEYTSPLQMVHDKDNKLFSEDDAKAQYSAAMELYHMHEQLYTLVDRINTEQKMIKDNMDSVSRPQTKKLLKEYDAKLEELRSTLLATKHKSIFADEKKLRENITELYGSVCNQECRPGNLQSARITVLNSDLKKGENTYEKISAEYADKTSAAVKQDKSHKAVPVNAGN